MYRHRQSPYMIVMQHSADMVWSSLCRASTRPSMDVEKSLSTIHGFTLVGHDIEPGEQTKKMKTRKWMPIKSRDF